MSNKITKRQAETSRNAIRTTQIINRLQWHGNGEDDQGNPVELTNSQIKAYEILLKHSLPALTATEITDTRDDFNPQEAKQRLMELLRTDPALARQVADIAGKRPELKAVENE